MTRDTLTFMNNFCFCCWLCSTKTVPRIWFERENMIPYSFIIFKNNIIEKDILCNRCVLDWIINGFILCNNDKQFL